MNGNSHPNQPSTDSHWCLWKLLIVGEGKLWYYHNFSLALHTGPHTSDLWLREIPDWVQDSPVWLVVCQLMENLLLLLPVSFVNPGGCVCRQTNSAVVGRCLNTSALSFQWEWKNSGLPSTWAGGCLCIQWEKKYTALLIPIYQKKLSNTKYLALPLTLSPRHILSAWTWPSIT